MNAEIVAVGSEMLTAQKIDTNSLYLTDQLNTLGVEVVQKCIIGDDRARLASYISEAVQRSEWVFITGGLGPTEDDVTRDAVAAALGREQTFRQDLCDDIAARFRSMKRHMAENNKRQAFLIDGAESLPNDRGSAPGQWIEFNRARIVLLPGPPRELKAMFQLQCLPRLTKLLPPQVIRTRFYRVAGMGESDLDQIIAPVYTRYTNPACTILAGPADIQIHLRARCDTEQEAEALLQEVGGQIEPLLGDYLYTSKGEGLEDTIGDMLRDRQETVCVAESATGGALGARFTSAPGSSVCFLGGFLTYTNEIKTALLGVPADLLQRCGAVCEEVAVTMAEGARSRLGTTYALSVTGVAGPDTDEKGAPVGTIYIGLAHPKGSEAKRFLFSGDRDRVRTLAVQYALDTLRRHLLSNSHPLQLPV